MQAVVVDSYISEIQELNFDCTLFAKRKNKGKRGGKLAMFIIGYSFHSFKYFVFLSIIRYGAAAAPI